MTKAGKVSLVGAGPGDPDLLTVKALRLIESAEVVVYDRLVSPEIMALIPVRSTRISVAKESGNHSLPQAEINSLLVYLAQTGRNVVRLKGGDPYIFGRGSEEAEELRKHDISFEVVPGITAASACSTYAGIPLTHRGLSRRVQLVTGHFGDNEALDLDWQGLADRNSTLVIYMGLSSAYRVCGELIRAGLPGDTPAAVVQEGSTPRQRRVLTTLSSLPHHLHEAGLVPPVLLIIGRTVALAERLDWFDPSGIAEQTEPASVRIVAHH